MTRKPKLAKCGVPIGIYPFDDPRAAFEQTYNALYVLLDGRRIAVRHDKKWVSLEPGFVVLDGPNLGGGRGRIIVQRYDVSKH
jgi:hypothetical protein